MAKEPIDVVGWKSISRLLDQALELPPPALESWFDALAPEFDALKPRLRRMLARHARVETGDFLDTLPKFAVDVDALAQSEQPGDVIGPYTLERELGSGGMGVVWLARRSDGLIGRPVALKLPHGAWRRAGLAERMAREREILASLSHPNIARLFDAGVTAAGQPWLAIEYIEGTRIDEYCRARSLGLSARLELFAQVAAAVAHAHGKLVVHRDLKPANILVTNDGQVHLLDFGIAKLLEDGEARATRFTEISGRALTPDYASPEQVLGEPLTVASDVYSLGVVLYELLCGRRPYQISRDSRGALEDAILRADAPPPSELAEPSQRRALRGDLDTITLKALQKIPARRYPTVHALLDDIERHLKRRPVLAQRDSRWYRARKFIARNRLAVGATAAVAFALVAGTVVATWQARAALAEKARAEEVQKFIASVFSEADPMMQSEGKALSATQLLLQAEQRVERGDASPSLKVEMLAIIGESLIGLQDSKEAARILDKALRLQPPGADANATMTARLHLALSRARENLGENDAAVGELGKTFVALKSVRDAGTLAVHARLHESALGLTTGDYAVTERAARQAIAEADALLGPRSDESAEALMFISKAAIFTERNPEAVASAREGMAILLANHHGDYSHPKLIEFAPYYANALIHTGDFDGASGLMREMLAHADQIYGARSGISGELASIAVPAELERGELDTAIVLARRAVANYVSATNAETTVYSYRARILGLALVLARSDDAMHSLDDAVQLSGRVGEPNAGRTNFGLALALEGRLDEADEQLRPALESAPTGSYPYSRAARFRGLVLRLRSRPAEALTWLEQSVAGLAKRHADRGEHAMSLVELGMARLDLGKVAEAEQSFALAEKELTEVQHQRMTPARADLLLGMSRVRMLHGEFSQALPDLSVVEGYWRARRPDSRWAGEAALWLGRDLRALRRGVEGNEVVRRAIRLLGRSRIPMDQVLVEQARREAP